jgi:hypothetical protein
MLKKIGPLLQIGKSAYYLSDSAFVISAFCPPIRRRFDLFSESLGPMEKGFSSWAYLMGFNLFDIFG